MSTPRTILHVDMDAFYVSVERLDRRELVGQPLPGSVRVSGGVGDVQAVLLREHTVRHPAGSLAGFPDSPRLASVTLRHHVALRHQARRTVLVLLDNYLAVSEGVGNLEAGSG